VRFLSILDDAHFEKILLLLQVVGLVEQRVDANLLAEIS
jgi:hypothetical protein